MKAPQRIDEGSARRRSDWAAAFHRRMEEYSRRGDFTFEEMWTGDLLRALQFMVGFHPAQVWVFDREIMQEYKNTGTLPRIAALWVPEPLDPDELTLEDFAFLGRSLRRKWSLLGWDETFGSLNGHCALYLEAVGLHKSAAHFKKTRLHVNSLTQGDRGERLLALWGFGVTNTSHLRLFGIHPEVNERGEIELLDNTQHQTAVREFLPLLIDAERESAWPALAPPQKAYKGRPLAATFKDFMLWGLVVMLEPLIHNYQLGRAAKKGDEYNLIDPSEFGRSRWPRGPMQQMSEAFLGLVGDLRDARGEKVPERRVEDILRQALARGPRQWRGLGLASPLTFAVDRAAQAARLIGRLGALPTRDILLNMAVEAVLARMRRRAKSSIRVEDFRFASRKGSPLHFIQRTKPGMHFYIGVLRPVFPALARELLEHD